MGNDDEQGSDNRYDHRFVVTFKDLEQALIEWIAKEGLCKDQNNNNNDHNPPMG